MNVTPTKHPKKNENICTFALEITPTLHLHTHTQNHLRGVAQPGSVLDWGSRGREFKSLHSDIRSQQSTVKSRLGILDILKIYRMGTLFKVINYE